MNQQVVLQNELCTFKVIQNGDLLEKRSDILSAVFFKMNQYYKDFSIYVDGLTELVKQNNEWNRDNPDNIYNLLMFIDRNIYEDAGILDILKRGNHTIIILFDCVDYKDKQNNKYHVDLFATMVRFFPMFDFESNPFDHVIITDIDMYREYPQIVRSFMVNKPSGFAGGGGGRSVHLFYENKRAYVFAGMCSVNVKQKYDKNILVDFIKNADKNKSVGFYSKRITPYGFGVDEVFLNEILFPIINTYTICFRYRVNLFMSNSTKYIMDEKRRKWSNIIFDIILGKYGNKSLSLEEKIKIFSDGTYKNNKPNEKNSYFIIRFSQVIKYLYENNKKWMERNVISFIYKYLLNVLYGIVYINTNTNGDILGCTIYKKIKLNNVSNNISSEIQSNLSDSTDLD